jgi:hypothetical protein
MRPMRILIAASLAACLSVPAFAQDGAAGFAAIDKDGDGLVSIDELTSLMPAFAGRAAAEHLVVHKDEDGDGKLTLAELKSPVPVPKLTIVPDIAFMAPFEMADLNGDGRVTLAELNEKGPAAFSGVFSAYAQKADRNGDGALSKTEWEADRPTMTVTASATDD